MKQFKKSIAGSVLALFIGTSCCWLSSLFIWIGGLAFFTAASKYLENILIPTLILCTALAIFSVSLYRKKSKKLPDKKSS